MKIVAFGEVMMRMMVPDHKLLTQSDTLEYLFTGTGVNILSGLSLMQEDCYLCTVLPDNRVGYAAAAAIRKTGIHDQFISYQGDHIGIYILEKGYGARPDKVTYLNRSASSFGTASVSDIDAEAVLDGMDALHICGIALAINESTRALALHLVRCAKAKGVTVIFDCNYRPSLWKDGTDQLVKQIYSEMLQMADVVFAGEKDATLMFGIQSKHKKNTNEYLNDVLSQLKEMFSIQTIAGTLRDASANTLQGYTLQEHGFYLSKIHPLEIYDRIGGGDAFAAGFLHTYLNGEEPAMQIEFATCSGVLGHTTYGDSPVSSKQDILDYMQFGKSDIKR